MAAGALAGFAISVSVDRFSNFPAISAVALPVLGKRPETAASSVGVKKSPRLSLGLLAEIKNG